MSDSTIDAAKAFQVGGRLLAIIEQQESFQTEKFPNHKLEGILKHLKREVDEIEKEPKDIIEWADALILYIGAMRTAGIEIYDVIKAVEIKQDINKKREWHEADADGVYSHKKEPK